MVLIVPRTNNAGRQWRKRRKKRKKEWRLYALTTRGAVRVNSPLPKRFLETVADQASSSLDGRTRGGDMAIPRARHVVERKPERRREQQLVSARESELEDEE